MTNDQCKKIILLMFSILSKIVHGLLNSCTMGAIRGNAHAMSAASGQLIAVLLSAVFFCVQAVGFAHAQDLGRGTISVTPLIIELELDAGDTVEREIQVQNMNNVVYEISFESFDVEVERETHNVNFLPEASKQNVERSLASWVSPLGSSSLQLDVGEQLDFGFEIDVPELVAPGDYYSSLNFYYTPVDGQQGDGTVLVRQSLGVLLLLTVKGDGDITAETVEFDFSGPQLRSDKDGVQLEVDIFNNSLRYVHLKPVLSLLTAAGETLFESEGSSKRVFPGERTTLGHEISAEQLVSGEALELHYAFWDRQGQTQYYQGKVLLDVDQEALVVDTDLLDQEMRALFLAALIGLVVLLLVVWRRRRMKSLRGSS